uniref:Uncharacterized protein n=1 Tax=Denticeps clupeoides TaxID=299321 RepID=A0AAY3ZVY3_9TELE
FVAMSVTALILPLFGRPCICYMTCSHHQHLKHVALFLDRLFCKLLQRRHFWTQPRCPCIWNKNAFLLLYIVFGPVYLTLIPTPVHTIFIQEKYIIFYPFFNHF